MYACPQHVIVCKDMQPPTTESALCRLEQGGPAAQSHKILSGDILLDVDGHSIAGKPLLEVQKMLAGEAHSPVTMTVSRPYGSPRDNGPQQVYVVMFV